MHNKLRIGFSGLPQGYCFINMDEIMRMKKTTVSVKDSKPDLAEITLTYTGVVLETILEQCGIGKAEYTGVRFMAANGYSVEISNSMLHQRDILLAYEMNGRDLVYAEQPLRVIIPEEREMYWVSNLAEVELIKGQQSIAIHEVLFFENLLDKMNCLIYSQHDENEQAVNLKELLSIDEQKRIIIKAIDGLEKKETLEIKKRNYYIKFTGQDAPLFTADDLPQGMEVKKVGLLLNNQRAIVFLSPFLNEKKEISGQKLYDFLKNYLPDTAIIIQLADRKQITVNPYALRQKVFMYSAGKVLMKGRL